jgi:hypothetical protein
MDLPNPTASDELLAFVEAAAPTAEDWYHLSAALLGREQQTGDLQAGWLMTAFDYHLARRVGEKRDRPAPFGEMIAGEGGTYPTPVPQVPQEVIDLWSNSAERTTQPALQARLHHLLFERGEGNRGTHGREAARAYLALGVGPWSRLERANCLHWAIDLAKRVGDRETVATVIPALIDLATESLGQEKHEPGVALHALEVLAFEDPANTGLPELLERARQTYTDPFLASSTIRIQEQIYKGDAAKREQLRRETVLAHYDHAMGFGPGMLRMSFLEDAARLASLYGLSDLGDQATQAMQEMSIEDLDLKPISTQINLPMDVIDAHVAAIVGQESFGDVLRALVAGEPPSGDLDHNRSSTAEIAKLTPFASLLPRTHLGDDGLARYTATSDADRIDEQLARIEGLGLGISGMVNARILREALDRFAPSFYEIASTLQAGSQVSPAVARSIAKALLAFQAEAFEEAATVAMPRVETMVRALCQEKNVLRFRVQREHKSGRSTRGQYPQLGALLAKLRPWMDPSWDRFLWTFLVSPFGPNFRNELLHGYTEEVTATTASLTIIAVLRLALVPLLPGSAPEEDQGADAADPPEA